MANASSVTLGTFCMSKMSAMRRSCCSLSRLALRKMSPRCGACVSSCGMAVLLADGIGVQELPDYFRLILTQVSALFLEAMQHIVEARHHFLPFLRVEIDANTIVTCQEFRRPFYLR